jgi:signal transduction histidine kinase/CheY-like chemotaxis protein
VPQRLVKANYLVRHAPIIVLFGFGLVLAAAAAVGVLVVRSNEADRLVSHTIEVQQTAETLLSELQAAESAKRGYLLTGDKDYVTSFVQASGNVPGLLESLRKLTADNPAQQTRLFASEPLIDTKLEEMKHTLSLDGEGRREEAIGIIRSSQGKNLVEAIRVELFSFLRTERDLLRIRQDRAAELRRWLAALIGVALLSAMVLAGILALATRNSVRGLMERTKELEEESRRRQEAEDTLRQVQKMEAVGQLTGGIAHDFNNLLTIIIGNLDTLKRHLTGGLETAKDGAGAGKDRKANDEDAAALAAKLERPVDAAMYGARSAAQLTQRLLAFSRRQALDPIRLDMNRLVADMLDMLRRSLGEQISVETVLGAGLWPAFADANQLENALLNLAVNAKAAMPEGGCLTIETANVNLDEAYARRFGDIEAGQYVALSVTDTGTGIPAEILDHVFEPFFTTKPHGEGSGLGLAMVHGFVKQSGGHLRIYSEESHGTTVKLYLPRMTHAEEMSAVPAGKEDVAPAPRAEPHETILLVEDNAGVRDYAKSVLESLGYNVIEAVDAADALAILADRPPIDLLFTDVVLPGGATGRDLADEVLETYPGLPVLFTTGYTRNAIVHQGRLDADVQLLGKPYTAKDLGQKVRDMLDRA